MTPQIYEFLCILFSVYEFSLYAWINSYIESLLYIRRHARASMN